MDREHAEAQRTLMEIKEARDADIDLASSTQSAETAASGSASAAGAAASPSPESVPDSSIPPADAGAIGEASQAARIAALLDEGRATYKAQDYERCEQVFREALEAGAPPAECRRHLARIYNRNADWPRALEQWQWLRDFDPSGTEPPLQIARALFRLNRLAEARDAFQVVLSSTPDHAEAQQTLRKIGDLQKQATPAPAPREEPSEGSALLEKARVAFKAENYSMSEALFLRAIEMGAEEESSRLHLARIYNLQQDWDKAQQQWKWLRDFDRAKLEPHLQVARGHFRLDEYAAAILEFKAVLSIQPDHEEAQQALARIAVLQEEETIPTDPAEDDSWLSAAPAEEGSWLSAVPVENGSWLSAVPAEMRWKVSTDLLSMGGEAIEALIDLATRQTTALGELIGAYADADGDLAGHRQLYAAQAGARVSELVEQLKTAKRNVRALARRTEKMLETFGKFTGRPTQVPPPVRQPLPRAAWRETLVKAALDIHRVHGLDATLAWLLREALVDDRQIIFTDLATALRETDREGAVRLLWLAYGAKPSPAIAERLASKMFQGGDLTNAGALMRAAPASTASPFVMEMRSSAFLFREGLNVPGRRKSNLAGSRVAYVASGSLPYQVAGYTTRTHQLLTGLVHEGVDCVCFTRPGFPWDRPRAMSSGLTVPERQVVGEVTYVHSPLPSAALRPEKLVEDASEVLARHFREHDIGIVQAASNSRNGLPALLAARKVGAKFIYEVRGLWELTAASRFNEWEETERYRLDRKLEVLAATNADHVLTITGGVAEELISGGVSPDRLSLLPNGVNPDTFRPLPKDRSLMARFGLTDEDFVTVYAGSLTNYEGLDDVIIALSLLRREGVRAKMLIVGDGAFRRDLEGLAVERGVSDIVIFAGRLRPDEIEACLSLADVVPIPRKPFKVCMVVSPLKPFEAMAMAKAVILSDLPALREIVTDGETGLICKPDDPVDLAAAMGRLAKDPALRDRLGRAAREWVVAHRSWAQNAGRLRRLYDTLRNPANEQDAGSPPRALDDDFRHLATSRA